MFKGPSGLSAWCHEVYLNVGAWRRRCRDTRVYPKVSRLAAWSENCIWYSSLLLSAVVSLFCESV
jgi:hypothetical protein